MSQPPVRFSTKLLYGLGEIPITVAMVLFGLFTLFFYNSVLGLPASLVGVCIFIGLAVDAVLDPYIGYRSDSIRRWLGRRHSLMLPAAILLGPSFWLLFRPPRNLSHSGLFAWLLVCWIAVRLSSALYRIPYLSLGAELSSDYDQRTSIFATRALFGLAGTLAAAGLSFLLFFPASADGSDPKLHFAGYSRMGLVFGAVMSITGLLSAIATLPYRSFGDRAASDRSGMPFWSGFRISMANTSFRGAWFYFVLFYLGVVLNASVAVQYFTWYAKIQAGTKLSAITSSFYVGACAGVFLWMTLAKRFEKRRLCVIATLGTSALLFSATLLIGEGRLFGTGSALPLLLGHLTGGFIASALWVLPPSMIADVADEDEVRTDRRREGMYFGILNLGEKISSGGALLLAGVLLSLLGQIAPGAAPGQRVAAPYIGLMYGAVPGTLLVLASLLILPYRLDRRSLAAIQERRAIHHAPLETRMEKAEHA